MMFLFMHHTNPLPTRDLPKKRTDGKPRFRSWAEWDRIGLWRVRPTADHAVNVQGAAAGGGSLDREPRCISRHLGRICVPSLFVIQGRDQGRRFELRDAPVTLGRDAVNEITLQDSEVSRQHARLEWVADDRTHYLVDLESSNGSFVNGQKLHRQPLRSGDSILLGRTTMIYTGVEDLAIREFAESVDIEGDESTDASQIVRSCGDGGGDLDEEGGLPPGEAQWLARARSNLQIMYRTALAVSHTMDIDQLLSRIMELIFEWVEADRGCIMLVEGDEEKLVPKVRRNRAAVRSHDRLSISSTILDYVLSHREGVLTSDARDDDRWSAGGSIVKLGVREAICVPMRGRYGNVGVIYIDTHIPPGHLAAGAGARKFSEEHLKLMVAIAHQAALAVEDTAYYSAMVQAERLAAMGQTIAGLSHHIKNILQGMNGGSYLINEGLQGSDTGMIRKGWEIVRRNQEKVSRLVLDMLAFSKERRPEIQRIDLRDLVREAVEMLRRRAEEAEVTLVCHLGPAPQEAQCDSEGISHAILNVLTNALDACGRDAGESRAPGRVEVGFEPDGDAPRVRIRVQDNGIGIAPDRLERIFQIFESSKGNRGTGLGLAVSRKILREHGGDIHVESVEGHGSRFTLELPRTPSAPLPVQDTNPG